MVPTALTPKNKEVIIARGLATVIIGGIRRTMWGADLFAGHERWAFLYLKDYRSLPRGITA